MSTNDMQADADAGMKYSIQNTDDIMSPGLVVFRDLVEHNLKEMVRIAGSPDRLRPHCKTHKTREIVQMQMALGVTRHKCATLREAQMLAELGVKDILIAYQLVGPNISRLIQLIDQFPGVRFACLIDDPRALNLLAASLNGSEKTVGVFLDVDPGMNRTGVVSEDFAVDLYEMICTTPGIEARGLHWYDGHHREKDVTARTAQIDAAWEPFTRLRNRIVMNGFGVPSVIAAGTGSFPILAEKGEPNLELSPGTVTYFDIGYQRQFPEMPFHPALGILTRVISTQRDGYLTLDVGHKSCAADPPAGSRLVFPTIPDAQESRHTEEHLVIGTERAREFDLGDAIVALPVHACPTSAVHEFANVVANGQVVEQWEIASRGRRLKT